MSFSGSEDGVVYILVSIKNNIGKDMDSGHYYCDILDYNKVTLWRYDNEKISEFRGYPDNVYDELLLENEQ